MKKILSLALAALMLVSAVPMVYAADVDYTQGTAVTYTATGTEAYTVTVPAELAPGASGTVTLEGTWASNQTVKVTADTSVVLTNSINAADTKTLSVTFAGIEKAGDNTESKKYTETVAVADIENALFGTWNGVFNYNTEMRVNTLARTTWQFNDNIFGYENMNEFVYGSSSNSQFPSGTIATDGNVIVSVVGLNILTVEDNAAFCYSHLSSDSHNIIYIPQNDVIPSLHGWYTVPAYEEIRFLKGKLGLEEFVATFVPTIAPKITFCNKSNSALENSQLIDWMYDNAVMQ